MSNLDQHGCRRTGYVPDTLREAIPQQKKIIRKSSPSSALGCFKAEKIKMNCGSQRAQESFRNPVSMRTFEYLWRHFIYPPLFRVVVGSCSWDWSSENIQEFYFSRLYTFLKGWRSLWYPPWPSLSSKGQIQTTANKGKSGQERQD